MVGADRHQERKISGLPPGYARHIYVLIDMAVAGIVVLRWSQYDASKAICACLR